MPYLILQYKQGIGSATSGFQVFTFTGSTTNVDITSIPINAIVTIKAWGAAGGGGTQAYTGAAGGYARGIFARTAITNPILTVSVGGGGVNGSVSQAGGFGGGGSLPTGTPYAGTGGGYTRVMMGATPLVVAGGGGGGSALITGAKYGGPGGGYNNNPNGLPGSFPNSGTPGQGGTQVAGGAGADAADGAAYDGGAGSAWLGGLGNTQGSRSGGGGGGGFYGGGGGNGATTDINVGGAGGGSSYVNPVATTSFFDGANTLSEANRAIAPQQSDDNYIIGVAQGGTSTGGPGLLVIEWALP